MSLLAIEISTSAVKAVIFQEATGIVKTEQSIVSKEISDGMLQDPKGIFEAMMALTKRIIIGYEDQVSHMVVSSVWSSLLLTNAIGKPIDRIHTWADMSGDEVIENYKEQQCCETIGYVTTGCPMHLKYPRWKYHKMVALNQLPLSKEFLKVSSLPEYIYEQLTEQNVISAITASGSGFYNQKKQSWDEGILEEYGLKTSQFGTIVEPTFRSGLLKKWQDYLNIKQQIEVSVPNADGGMNQYAEGRYQNDVMSMSVGTSAAIRMTRKSYFEGDMKGLWTHYLGKDHYIVGATISGAGNCIQWFMNQLNNEGYSYEILEDLLIKVDVTNAPLYLPFMFGEQSPGWRMRRSYGFCDRKRWHETQDLYYGLLEGILFNLFQGYERMQENGFNPKVIKMSGGIIQSPYWSQMAADIFHQEIEVSTIQHSSLMGAIYMYLDEIEASYVCNENRFIVRPNPESTAILEQRYLRYKQLYE
jgi:gluconokinase